MDKVEMILRFVAKKMRKSDGLYKNWTAEERVLMDLAIYGEFVVVRKVEASGSQIMKRFYSLLLPVLSCGSLIKFENKLGVKGVQYLADKEVGLELMKRFNKWERENEEELAPHPHIRRIEWYRQDLILRFS